MRNGYPTRVFREDNWIRYDSFIAPAVIRGLFRDVHFFCLQDDTDPGVDQDTLDAAGARQTLHLDVAELSHAKFDAPVIFDLCLDLFNRSDQWLTGDLTVAIRSAAVERRPRRERQAVRSA